MAFVIADRVREFATTSGTGQIFLGGAAVGFRTFSDGIGNGNTTFYAISVPGGAEWEVGIGTVGVGTLTRDTVLASSNGGALVDFAAGTKDVFATYAGAGAVMGVGDEIHAPDGTRLPVEHGGTGVTSAEAEVTRLAGAGNTSELLANLTTADLAESPTNLYYTNARVDARLASELGTAATRDVGTEPNEIPTNDDLGSAATRDVGTGANTVAAGDDSRITGAAQKSANLSDLANSSTARTNLGLGTAATRDVTISTADPSGGVDGDIWMLVE